MLFWLMASTMHAAIVTEQEAKQKALDFMATRGHRTTAAATTRIGQTSRRAGAPATGTDRYYLFNIGHDEGFVIVSGDDRTPAILGYADSGSISFDNMPDGLRYLLNGYAEEMEWLESQEESDAAAQARAAAPAHAAIRSTIAPLIQTRWDQGQPYNNNCPYINSEKTVTGCVATSMAQVMYYHRWPAVTTAIPAYSIKTKDQNKQDITISSEVLHELPATTFNWNNMTLTYSSASTGDPADAVAELMQYCGWSLQMIYGLSINGGSGTYTPCIPDALKTYFGYDNDTRVVYRKFYSYQEWISLIYDELIDERPVIMGAQSSGGGHSFICDGYDTDDYFHINWGWSGSSDGYFRLSLLNPYDQGIGGSTTRDGFSAGQAAVIGIQKPTVSTNSYCLSLEGLNFGSPDANATTKTFTRDAETNSFTGINLSFTICSYRFRENSFDYAIQLVNSNGSVVDTLATEENLAMSFNINFNCEVSIAIPSDVADGTYTIKVMSRHVGTADWQECYMADRFQLSAEISGNSLTINVPIPAITTPTAATFRVNGNKTKGYEQEVIASITGGASDYHDDLYLRVNGTSVMGRQADIPAGQTVDVHFKYTPTKSGQNTLAIYNKKSKGTQIGTSTVINITDSDASNTQELTFGDPVFTNLTTGDNPKLYGNAVRASIRVYNPSTVYSYASQLNCSLRKYDSMNENGHEGEYVDATVQHQFITIAKSESGENLSFIDVNFEFNGVEPGKFYRLRFSYTKADENGNATTASGPISACYEMGAGYIAYNTDGTVTIKPVVGTITADEDNHVATFVDLSAISSFDGITVTPSANPNCLYRLPEQPAATRGTATAPNSLEGRNVIYGETAESITLTDNYDFYSPIAFTANEITYTRTFTLAANGSSGWSTIMLPFDVTRITVADGSAIGKTVDWFHSADDTGKNFWLKTFSGDNNTTVYFDYATAMNANTPYIIAVPDDRWGEEWQMTNKPVTFYGENSYIAATIEHSISGNNYKFFGKTAATSLNDGYALNDIGSTFAKISEATAIGAFRAWISSVSISSFTQPALAIGSGLPVSISMPTAAPTATDADIYDLQGRRLTTKPRGIYINSGKKYIGK